MELWDAYDSRFVKAEGTLLVRGEKIPAGLFHLVCDVIVRHADGTYLLMQRDPRKHFGGMWEATAGGSALRGETPAQCAARELLEETGIAANSLSRLGTVRTRDTIYVEFMCAVDIPKNAVTLQPGETTAYMWATAEEIRSMKRSELVTERMHRFVSEICGGGERPANEQKEEIDMITVYTSPLCPDCREFKVNLDAHGVKCEYVDITGSMKSLKAFLKLRDSLPVFAPCREIGSVGIPAIVRADGSVTLDWEGFMAENGLAVVYRENGVSASCGLDGKGC